MVVGEEEDERARLGAMRARVVVVVAGDEEEVRSWVAVMVEVM